MMFFCKGNAGYRPFLLCISLLALTLLLDSCRPPRCNVPGCYVRMNHRHGSLDPSMAPPPNSDDPSYSADLKGKVYRGVPWWQRNRNPKIGDGFKSGYKYNYRKGKFKVKKDKSRKNQPGALPDAPAEEAAPETRKSRKQRRAEKKQKTQEIKEVVPEEESDGF
jgi:hypothetical protein